MPISHEQLARNAAFDADPEAGIAGEGDQAEAVTEAVEDAPIGPGNETPQEAVPSVGFGLKF